MWSYELRQYTLEHFGDSGAVYLKSNQPRLYALGIDRTKGTDDFFDMMELEKLIPETYSSYPIVLFNRTGFSFLTAYKNVKDMVNDGWAID